MSNQSPIATTIFCEIRETIINLLTVSLMAILWQRFGLQVTLPIFIVTLLFVAPLIGASRLPLVAITFLTIGIDMAKEKKISEAGIFFIVVVISILIDELIRGLNKGFPKLQLKSLKPSPERNMLFAFSSSAFFFAYLIYEHYSMSNPFFAKLGDALINSFPNISRGGGNTGFTVFIIMVVGTFPGATISSIMSSESDVFKPRAVSF